MELILTNTFDRSLTKLTGEERKVVNQAVMQFRETPDAPGLRWHPLKMRESRFFSISPNMDLRVIVLADGARRSMMYVDHHDAAYKWANGRTAEVHERTGSIQIVEFEEVVREQIVYVQREVELPPLFIEETDDYLLSLGVPPVYLPYVKQASDEDQLLAVCARLPDEAAEALMTLATGDRPEPTPVAAGTDPYETPDAKRRFWVAASDEELQRALDAPWAQWTTFLHPSQRDAVERNFNGPARISGSAGTGKSVVAMHRTANLAKASSGGRLFLTTFNKALAYKLSEGMDMLLGADSDARGRVTVTNLHAYAVQVLSEAGTRVDVVKDDAIKGWIAEARGDLDASWTDGFLFSEWEAVIDYWGLRSFADYRAVARSGRGKPLNPRERKTIWPIFESILSQMAEAGQMTWGDVSERAADVLTEQGLFPFRHVIVDEAQDLGPRELGFVQRLAPDGPRSLFFVGDIGQRIYRWPFAWSQIGLDIRGRARRLTVNYRTSQQIRRFADRLLPDMLDSPDGSEDRNTVSLLIGPDPEVIGCADVAAEQEALQTWLTTLRARGVLGSEIAVLARTRAVHQRTTDKVFAAMGIEAAKLTDSDISGDRVSAGTFHTAKGLEFRAVAVLGCEEGRVPLESAIARENGDEAKVIARERERHLLYVACTRARESLLITYVGAPSLIIDG